MREMRLEQQAMEFLMNDDDDDAHTKNSGRDAQRTHRGGEGSGFSSRFHSGTLTNPKRNREKKLAGNTPDDAELREIRFPEGTSMTAIKTFSFSCASTKK